MRWSTSLELDSIKRLGTFSERKGRVSRTNLLRGYLESCRTRKDWNHIDKNKVVEFAKQELAKENQ